MQVKTVGQLLDEWVVTDDERIWLAEMSAAVVAATGASGAAGTDTASKPLAAVGALWARLGEVGVFDLAAEGSSRAVEIALAAFALGTLQAPGPLAATIMAAAGLEGAAAQAAGSGSMLAAVGSEGVFSWLRDVPQGPGDTDRCVVLDLSTGTLRHGSASNVRVGVGLTGEPLARAAFADAQPCRDADVALALGALTNAGYLCGIGEKALALAVTHAAERRQFGQPILSFQDVGHRLADARAGLTASEQLLYLAARSLVAEPDTQRGLPLAARALGSAVESSSAVARIAHQTFGAYGFTNEAPLAAVITRIHDLGVGAPGRRLARSGLARALADQGGGLGPLYLDAAANLLTHEELAFRVEVRDFVDRHRPVEGTAPYFRITDSDDDAVEAIHRELAAKDWLTLGWPVEHGGSAASPVLELLLWDAMAEARLARPSLGASVVARAIMRYGSESMRAEYLPGLARGELLFALGISEPEAGSDLRNVRLTATPTGDDYVLEGMKVWTSNAHRATHLFVLTRVAGADGDGPGYSVFVVPMTAQGLRVRGIGTLDGARLNEVHFESVLVPAGALIGSVGAGFAVLGAALDKERHLQFLPGRLRRDLADAVAWLDADGGLPAAVLEHQLIPLVERVSESEATALNLARHTEPGRRGLLAAQHKLRWGETCQLINRLPFDLGLAAAAFGDGSAAHAWKQSLNETIGGGTSEMMRRTITRDWVLG